ncbi:hypothetical protein KAF25_002843 [Fusarium avenaceum]|uniref:PARP catalytic domain-containing protein n=1 Tax=Fusarium avenaceum TaxID=40199 RepID=A0A9P7KU70_9HYPO|nr:hypothetical protein KAF25_002843 [Fusarium avenaceum]
MMESYKILEGHRPPSLAEWSCSQDEDSGHEVFNFTFTKLVLHLELSSDHRSMISCRLTDTDGSFNRKTIDPIREEIRCNMRSVLSNGSLPVRKHDLEIGILQTLEAIHELELEFKTENARRTRDRYGKGWAADQLSDWSELINNPYGLDVSTIQDTAYLILGKTPEELVAEIPKEWRIIHVESVLRRDFVGRFCSYQETLRRNLQKPDTVLRDRIPPHSKLDGRVRSTISREDIIEDMLTPRVTYHGTRIESVASIVRHGFKMPGDLVDGHVVASPRSGIAFDRGIYSSQAPFYALSFARGRQTTPLGMLPSMRLFVCATVMGRTLSSGSGVHGPLVDGFDAHFDGRFEYIVHNERAILPCYVIHLDLGSEAAKRALKELQSNPEEFYSISKTKKRPEAKSTAPGDIQREKEARKASAMKWFPYGFGPATGTRFVIEEVGDISDDEEEYGEWQADKHGFSNTYMKNAGVWDEDEGQQHAEEYDDDGNPVKRKGLLMDQYQHIAHPTYKK